MGGNMTEASRRGLAAASIATAGALLLAGTGTAQATDAESTFDRVRRTKVMRIGAVTGALPYFDKDLATGKWTGAVIEMAADLAKAFDAKVKYVESTWGDSVLDLQTNKIDVGFALNPTPARALSINFCHDIFIHPFGCVAKHGLKPASWTWEALNNPETRISCDLGSLHETLARRYCPKARITAVKGQPEALLALQSGRVDVTILAAVLGLAAIGKNPSLGTYHILQQPFVALPTDIGVQREPDTRFREVVNAWLDYNRGVTNIRQWMISGLAKEGVKPSQIPPELTF